MFAWHGLTPTDGRECPLTVVDRPCTAGHDLAQACLCERYLSRTFDHARLWRDASGRLTFTAEPYDFDPSAHTDVVAELAALGITTTITDRSPWNRGRTTLLILSAQPIPMRGFVSAEDFFRGRSDWLEICTVEVEPNAFDIVLKIDGTYFDRDTAREVAESFTRDLRHLLANLDQSQSPGATEGGTRWP
ncbi:MULTISPECIES: hypothetical protein [Rhodococcus]|uniref:hypothetical protein n=1 Tax=Rhodococcus TaxID=1827 RepID=UPI0011AF96E7|nr:MULTISPECIES: hypothetical protein [Rhodococcus]WKX00251.1 hypothetical protein Q3O43_08130 [Rhodococcus aetherivorans]